jgi:hypothetical protein
MHPPGSKALGSLKSQNPIQNGRSVGELSSTGIYPTMSLTFVILRRYSSDQAICKLEINVAAVGSTGVLTRRTSCHGTNGVDTHTFTFHIVVVILTGAKCRGPGAPVMKMGPTTLVRGINGVTVLTGPIDQKITLSHQQP